MKAHRIKVDGERREIYKVTRNEHGDILLHLDNSEVWQLTPHNRTVATPALEQIQGIVRCWPITGGGRLLIDGGLTAIERHKAVLEALKAKKDADIPEGFIGGEWRLLPPDLAKKARKAARPKAGKRGRPPYDPKLVKKVEATIEAHSGSLIAAAEALPMDHDKVKLIHDSRQARYLRRKRANR